MKKLLSILLSAAFLFLLFGCGPSYYETPRYETRYYDRHQYHSYYYYHPRHYHRRHRTHVEIGIHN